MVHDNKAQGGRSRLGAWRAGRSDLRLHALSVFSLAVAFVCLAAALLVVTNIQAVRDRWARAGRATVYLRENAPGPQEERWYHLYGCRRWLTLTRDTVDNLIGEQ